jgi:hypothetical protein
MALKSWLNGKLDGWIENFDPSRQLPKGFYTTGFATGELTVQNIELNRKKLAAALELPPQCRIKRAFCSSAQLKVPSWIKLSKLRQKPVELSLGEVTLELEIRQDVPATPTLLEDEEKRGADQSSKKGASKKKKQRRVKATKKKKKEALTEIIKEGLNFRIEHIRLKILTTPSSKLSLDIHDLLFCLTDSQWCPAEKNLEELLTPVGPTRMRHKLFRIGAISLAAQPNALQPPVVVLDEIPLTVQTTLADSRNGENKWEAQRVRVHVSVGSGWHHDTPLSISLAAWELEPLLYQCQCVAEAFAPPITTTFDSEKLSDTPASEVAAGEDKALADAVGSGPLSTAASQEDEDTAGPGMGALVGVLGMDAELEIELSDWQLQLRFGQTGHAPGDAAGAASAHGDGCLWRVCGSRLSVCASATLDPSLFALAEIDTGEDGLVGTLNEAVEGQQGREEQERQGQEEADGRGCVGRGGAWGGGGGGAAGPHGTGGESDGTFCRSFPTGSGGEVSPFHAR